ncbi:MAG TPA: Xaa-Pro peptidase family protein [Gemmataceae bacterium]|nr:Xaa-Pro peptidase family protein [Gemmataceae bacterium]
MDQFPHRRTRLARALADEGLDLLVVSNPVNVSYLTNFSGESSYLLIGPKHSILVSDGRFTEQLAEECPGLEAHIRPSSKPIHEATGEIIAKLGARAVGFESGHLTVNDLESLHSAAETVQWKPANNRIEKMRAVKDETEIEQIREAIRIAERAFDMFRSMLRADDSEKDLSDAMESYVRRAGGRCTSFPTIAAVGLRAALPHCPAGANRVSESELLLVDWGASGRFYKSDLTRVLIPRKTSRLSARDVEHQLQEVYDVVLRAQLTAIAAIRPGVKSGDIDAAARKVITDAGYGEKFTHSTGHGIGMQVHEMPGLRAGTETVLEAGMVVTVEPGIYLAGWGGVRIEDDVLIAPDGCEVLTHVPKDLPAMLLDI